MEKDKFLSVIDEIQKFDKCIDDLYGIAKIDVISSPLSECFWNIVSTFIEQEYGKDGKEMFDWFVFEKSKSSNELKAFDNGKEICKNIEELWIYLENIKKEQK